jgi:hypothetical protein
MLQRVLYYAIQDLIAFYSISHSYLESLNKVLKGEHKPQSTRRALCASFGCKVEETSLFWTAGCDTIVTPRTVFCFCFFGGSRWKTESALGSSSSESCSIGGWKLSRVRSSVTADSECESASTSPQASAATPACLHLLCSQAGMFECSSCSWGTCACYMSHPVCRVLHGACCMV